MAVRRTKRRKAIKRTRVSSQTMIRVGGFGRSGDAGALARRVREAADIIAAGAAADAAGYPSVQIPDSIHVGQGTANTATIYADSPNARPIELGLRHPLFATGPKVANATSGGWAHWYKMKQRRFLENGAVMTADAAAAALSLVIDDWAEQLK